MLEFRVFFPIVSYLSARLRGNPLVQSLEVAQNSLFCTCPSTFAEVRTDHYLVTDNHFGVKFRSQKKLELKTRVTMSPPMLETWSKTKLKHKELTTDAAANILEILQEHRVGKPSDAEHFENIRFVEIEKARTNFGDFYKQIEFCNLLVKSGHSHPAQHWFSICIEGGEDSVKSAIRNEVFMPRLMEVLRCCKDIIEQAPHIAREAGLTPVLSGYPGWVCLLASDDPSKHTADFLRSYNELQEFIGNSQSSK